MSSCNGRNETMEDNYSFENFVKNLGKVFVITTTIVMCMAIRSRLVTPDSSLFHIAIFILGASFLFTMISVADNYVFSNVMMGVGIALGLQMAATPTSLQ
mgnify:FL=1|tara:strand:- start:5196 stop:5495 length:300 start_codon:yes stop_codon:yes gene_type:complete